MATIFNYANRVLDNYQWGSCFTSDLLQVIDVVDVPLMMSGYDFNFQEDIPWCL